LTFDKKGFDHHKELMSDLADQAQQLKYEFMLAIDEDMQSFNRIIEARRLPKGSPDEAKLRDAAILEANKGATTVPLDVLTKTIQLLELADTVVEKGNPNSLSDSGVAALTALAAAEGAYFNVLINIGGLSSTPEAGEFCTATRKQADEVIDEVRKKAEYIRSKVLSRL
jgi:glutamate formiminotransferase/formiminotetrahydrofolate cyclodeaminase